MKFAVSYSTPSFGTDPDRLIGYAQHAEACRFEGIYLPEHVVLYRGARLGEGLTSFPQPYEASTLPIHVGGSSRAAARRAGQRGDGFFPGGMLTPEERTAQWELAGAGNPALEYTRWGSITMSEQRVQALAAEGVTRVVVSATSDDPAE